VHGNICIRGKSCHVGVSNCGCTCTHTCDMIDVFHLSLLLCDFDRFTPRGTSTSTNTHADTDTGGGGVKNVEAGQNNHRSKPPPLGALTIARRLKGCLDVPHKSCKSFNKIPVLPLENVRIRISRRRLTCRATVWLPLCHYRCQDRFQQPWWKVTIHTPEQRIDKCIDGDECLLHDPCLAFRTYHTRSFGNSSGHAFNISSTSLAFEF
jgi:hypothetical protein